MGTHHPGTESERRALDAYIKLSRAAAAVEARINRHLSDVDLSISQFGVLEALYHLGPMHQGDLAGKILKTSGNLTLVVENLAKRGLVERRRDPQDRRYVRILPTDAGRRLIADFFPQHAARVEATFAALDPDEQATLAALCRKLGLAATASEASPAGMPGPARGETDTEDTRRNAPPRTENMP